MMPPKTRKKSGGKGKERKLKRKQEQAEVAASLSKIKAAYEMGDFMLRLPAFKRYARNGLSLNIELLPVERMPKDEQKWGFELLKSNMEAYYIDGGWGWNDKEKWNELTHESALAEMKKVVLTVFKDNAASVNFFKRRMNYVEDETSPVSDPLLDEEFSYVILSKTLARPSSASGAGSASKEHTRSSEPDLLPR